MIKPVNYPQGKEFYLTLPEKVFYFGRNIKNSHYVIPGIFVSSKVFKLIYINVMLIFFNFNINILNNL